MSVYFALMAMIGQLAVCVALSYPVEWVITRASRPVMWLYVKGQEWAEFNHRYDEERRHSQ